MSTEFKAVTPQRAVEIMRAWAYHPWPCPLHTSDAADDKARFDRDPPRPIIIIPDQSPAITDTPLTTATGTTDTTHH